MPEHTERLNNGLLAALKQRLEAHDFLERHRQTSKDFTRKRCLTCVTVVWFLLNLVKRSLQDELDAFFKLDSDAPVAARVVNVIKLSQSGVFADHESGPAYPNAPAACMRVNMRG